MALAGRSNRLGSAPRISVTTLLAGPNHLQLSEAAAGRGRISATIFDKRSGTCTIDLRVAHYFPTGRDRFEHARTGFSARCVGLVRRNNDERGQPYRAWRLHTA